MFGYNAKIEPRFHVVQKAVDDAKFRTMRRAGFAIMRSAKESIVKSADASAPGTPPTTRGRGRHNLKAAIFVDASAEDVIIGPRYAYVGDSGEAHEFGKSRKGDDFAERSFMGPALEVNQAGFAEDWAGEVGT